MRRKFCLLLALLLLTAALGGCGREEAGAAFTAEDEIFTYERIDPKKTQLVVSRTGNIELGPLLDAFEEANPDLQLVYVDITGGNAECQPLIDWVANGYAPDVVISAAGFFSDDLTEKYFEKLSTNPIIERYEAAALKRTATHDDIYWLPGPSDITALIYNRTLFEKYGWEPPGTFDEFVKLCLRIREDTRGAVEPWNPNAKYSDELMTAIEAFCYEELFGGVENRSWYNDFTRGEAPFIPHMKPYYEVLQTLIDNGILREEHFSYSATARGKEFAAGKIAMINMSIYDADNDSFDFGYLPFPGTKGELGYLSDDYSCFVGVPKKERTEKLQDAVDRFLSFFSSEKGQEAYIGKSMKVSNVKGVALNRSDDLSELQKAVNEGHLFALLNFVSEEGKHCNYELHRAAREMASGEKTMAECLADAEGEPYDRKDSEPAKAKEIVAEAERDMTVLETSFYIADAYRAAVGADIGLIQNGAPYRGNLMRIFKGDVTPALVNALKPRSFANDSALLKLSMTGAQLLEALNHPLGDGGEADCVYAFSGLLCEIAPWNAPGERMQSVRLSDGSAIDAKKAYTVAAWAGTVDEQYVTEVIEAREGSFEEILTEKMLADGAVKPADDGRAKLIWN